MEKIWAAIVTAVLGPLLLYAVKELKKERDRRRREEETRKQLEAAALKSVPEAEVTYTVEETTVQYAFDENGDGTYIRTTVGIQATQWFKELSLPYEHVQTTPGGRLGEPTLDPLPGSTLPITLEDLERTDGKVTGKIFIRGDFSPRAAPQGYKLTQPFERGVCLTEEEALVAYKRDEWKTEYVGLRVGVPMNRLRILLARPASHSEASFGAVAFIEKSERPNQTETDRLRNLLKRENGGITLTVENPSLKHTYAVWWMPPKQKKKLASGTQSTPAASSPA